MRGLQKWLACGLIAQSAMAVGATHSHAQEFAENTSLRFVPRDADLYVGSYKQSQQWQAFVNGPVAKKFLSLPVVQENWKTFLSQWNERDGQMATARMVLENPNAKDAIEFMSKLASEESFFFIDKNLSAWLKVSGELNDEIRKLAEQPDAPPEETAKKLFKIWVSRIESVQIPTMVMGAKCDDEDLAMTKVDQLEALIQLGTQFNPETAPFGRFVKRVDDDRGSRLTVELSGKQIPWDTIPTNEGFDEETKAQLQKALASRTVALTIGTLDKYFIVAFSERSKDLLNLGKAESLASHPDLSPVRNAGSNPITSISYVSDAFAMANYEAQVKDLFTKNFAAVTMQLERIQSESPGIANILKDVRSDLAWLDTEMAKLIPPSKGATSYSFLTPKGWEQVTHTRTKNLLLDGTAALSGLNHVGGSPIVMVVTRVQKHPEHFELVKTIVSKGKKYLDQFVELELLEGDDQAKLRESKEALDKAWPLVVRLSNAWENSFAPSLDGESGLVLSYGNLAAKQWMQDMPPSDVPLPLPEIATITKVTDSEKLKEGFLEVFDVFDEVVALARETNPDAIPSDYRVPRPTEVASTVGEKYGYPIPEDCPVPKTMMPQALIHDGYLIISYSDVQTETLAKSTSLAVGKGVIDASKPLANASYVHFGKLFAMFRPWARYAFTQTIPDTDASLLDAPDPMLQEYTLTANDLLSLWSTVEALGEISSTTSIGSNGETVTRSVYTQAE
ncbi:hypothetical protein VN12_02635 [Pirellula sp. SH-Sr6A]|uniref:hypothetical protein n=1 Tax=Pirellula sp. SH-Sr6A TaxID=1632865 RepID=UPI00078B74AE|nr:hypothetical protein [Pirellula sp. SH-Sr6A]AMV30984.1 hypothetical protein VN12_02635 [Pirellula sp. SH-Sr6A]